jgi:hypothetical protein
MTPFRPLALVLALCLAAPAQVMAATDSASSLAGPWRFTHARPAPWGEPLAGSADLTGQILVLAANHMQGPAPLDCGPARLETTTYPAEGLFQGGLPAPAEPLAQALGIGQFPVAGVRVTCDKGMFEFHRADADTLLLGLDNRVWTLSRAAGAQARADSPAGRVEGLLERHFQGPMGFDQATAQAKTPFQSKALNRLVAAYLARPRPQDEVPPINGDPYTDSQEYPVRFAVGAARVHQEQAWVPVRFADAWSHRTLTFELVREDGAWRLDDLDYGQGGRLSALLRE